MVDALVKNTILPFSPYKYETSGQTKKKRNPSKGCSPLAIITNAIAAPMLMTLVIAALLRIDEDEDDEPLMEVEEYWILSRVMIVGSFIRRVAF